MKNRESGDDDNKPKQNTILSVPGFLIHQQDQTLRKYFINWRITHNLEKRSIRLDEFVSVRDNETDYELTKSTTKWYYKKKKEEKIGQEEKVHQYYSEGHLVHSFKISNDK